MTVVRVFDQPHGHATRRHASGLFPAILDEDINLQLAAANELIRGVDKPDALQGKIMQRRCAPFTMPRFHFLVQ